jgi:hypothetical protein
MTIISAYVNPNNAENINLWFKESQKLIRIKGLTEETDIDSLTEEVIAQCALIHQSRFGEVRQLLYYLQTRKKPDNIPKGSYKSISLLYNLSASCILYWYKYR